MEELTGPDIFMEEHFLHGMEGDEEAEDLLQMGEEEHDEEDA